VSNFVMLYLYRITAATKVKTDLIASIKVRPTKLTLLFLSVTLYCV